MSTHENRLLAGAVGAFLVLLLAVVVYDRGRGDTIPKGVTVAGIDVGGKSPSDAREALDAQYAKGLKRPVVIAHGRQKWTLTPQQSKVAANLDAMVDEAAVKADDGNFLSRSWRRVTGGSVDSDLQPEVTFDKASVRTLVTDVKTKLNQPMRNADVHFASNGTFQKTSAQSGLRVDTGRLTQVIDRSLPRPGGKRSFHVPATILKPKTTDQDMMRKYGTVVVVDRKDFQLKLYKKLKLSKTYSVGLGTQGRETPTGLFKVTDKQVNPAWHVPVADWTGSLGGQTIPAGDPRDPLKSRWIGIVDGAGIHGVDPSEYASIGHQASHGCVRMRIDDVDDLYPRVPYGSQIYVS